MARDSVNYDAIIIGGGFFGLSIAKYLSQSLGQQKILVLEKESDLMTRASYNNQARVHAGYHYPRSLLTGLRSQVNFPRFIDEYEPAIENSFNKYYGVAKSLSKVSARQFKLFCERIGADIEQAPVSVKKLFNPRMVEDVFTVKEYAFNSTILKKQLVNSISDRVKVKCGEAVERLRSVANGCEVETQSGEVFWGRRVFNCSYSLINVLNKQSKLPLIPLKHEMAEMCLITLPPELQEHSVTMMCGPFFSFMPFPDRKLHTLSHVRYTPHSEWYDQDKQRLRHGHRFLNNVKKVSHFPHMLADVVRYMPSLADTKYQESLWEVKTVLAQSEQDDSRPILFRTDHGIKGYTCIMGGKLDNIYDVFRELDVMYGKT